MGLLLLLAALLLFAPAAHAISDPGEMLRNPVQEKRAEAIGSQLRCVVCQNESVEESNAGIARDFRHIIRVKVAAGESNEQIIAWMVARYGDFILLKPPFDPLTYVLWGAPLIALGAGAAAVLIVRNRRPSPGPPPLTEAERLRLDELTGPGRPAA